MDSTHRHLLERHATSARQRPILLVETIAYTCAWVRAAQANVAAFNPSDYVTRFFYDRTVHDAAISKWLSERVTVSRIVVRSDYSFPLANMDPLGTIAKAGFSVTERGSIEEINPRMLFPALH